MQRGSLPTSRVKNKFQEVLHLPKCPRKCNRHRRGRKRDLMTIPRITLKCKLLKRPMMRKKGQAMSHSLMVTSRQTKMETRMKRNMVQMDNLRRMSKTWARMKTKRKRMRLITTTQIKEQAMLPWQMSKTNRTKRKTKKSTRLSSMVTKVMNRLMLTVKEITVPFFNLTMCLCASKSIKKISTTTKSMMRRRKSTKMGRTRRRMSRMVMTMMMWMKTTKMPRMPNQKRPNTPLSSQVQRRRHQNRKISTVSLLVGLRRLMRTRTMIEGRKMAGCSGWLEIEQIRDRNK